MGTIATILIVLYLVVVLIIMLDKRLKSRPRSIDNQIDVDNDWFEAYQDQQKMADFSANLKSSPLMDGYDRPDL